MISNKNSGYRANIPRNGIFSLENLFDIRYFCFENVQNFIPGQKWKKKKKEKDENKYWRAPLIDEIYKFSTMIKCFVMREWKAAVRYSMVSYNWEFICSSIARNFQLI